jgi:uncharacterized membrane protein
MCVCALGPPKTLPFATLYIASNLHLKHAAFLKKEKNMVPGISEARDCHHFSTIFCGGIIIIIIMTIISIITTTTIIIINSIFLIVLEVAADWSVFFF